MKHLEVRHNNLLRVVFSSLFSVFHASGDETLRLMQNFDHESVC